jgi:hypothetical protein
MHAVEVETFVVSRDVGFPDKWQIKPVEISEAWKTVLGNDWDITMSSDPVFEPLYQALQDRWEQASRDTGFDILICEVLVEYTFSAPPGIMALRYGRHVWADDDQFWYLMVTSPRRISTVVSGDTKEWRVVGGFVRTVNMVSILERSHFDRRQRNREERRRAEEHSVLDASIRLDQGRLRQRPFRSAFQNREG